MSVVTVTPDKPRGGGAMAILPASEVEYLHEAAIRSRADVRGRRYTFMAIAATFTPLVGWTFALPWLLATLLCNEVAGPIFEKRLYAVLAPGRWLIAEA